MSKSTEKMHHKEKSDAEFIPITMPPDDANMEIIESLSDSEKYQIPHYFDTVNWKKLGTYRLRVSSIYDPSKFWVVFKDRELDYFQQYVHAYFTKFKSQFKVPTEKLKLKMYCIVNSDESFYRGILLNVPISLSDKTWAYVYCIDFGCISKVRLHNIYFMPKSMSSLPRFAVRASLEGLAPTDLKFWTSDVVSRFSELVIGKVLMAIVIDANEKRKVLNIELAEESVSKQIVDISEVLVKEKMAKILTLADIKENREVIHAGKYFCKMKYSYLFPSFDSIENCETPDSVIITQFLKEHLPLDYLFKTLYRYTKES